MKDPQKYEKIMRSSVLAAGAIYSPGSFSSLSS